MRGGWISWPLLKCWKTNWVCRASRSTNKSQLVPTITSSNQGWPLSYAPQWDEIAAPSWNLHFTLGCHWRLVITECVWAHLPYHSSMWFHVEWWRLRHRRPGVYQQYLPPFMRLLHEGPTASRALIHRWHPTCLCCEASNRVAQRTGGRYRGRVKAAVCYAVISSLWLLSSWGTVFMRRSGTVLCWSSTNHRQH